MKFETKLTTYTLAELRKIEIPEKEQGQFALPYVPYIALQSILANIEQCQESFGTPETDSEVVLCVWETKFPITDFGKEKAFQMANRYDIFFWYFLETYGFNGNQCAVPYTASVTGDNDYCYHTAVYLPYTKEKKFSFEKTHPAEFFRDYETMSWYYANHLMEEFDIPKENRFESPFNDGSLGRLKRLYEATLKSRYREYSRQNMKQNEAATRMEEIRNR